MLAGLAAVIQNVGVGAAGFFKGIGQDGHTVEGTLIVDGLGDFLHRAVVLGQPRAMDGDGAEGIAEDVTEGAALATKLNLPAVPPAGGKTTQAARILNHAD